MRKATCEVGMVKYILGFKRVNFPIRNLDRVRLGSRL